MCEWIHGGGVLRDGEVLGSGGSQPMPPLHLVLAVDYLGKEESNLTVNFSRPGAQIVGQCEIAGCALMCGCQSIAAAASRSTPVCFQYTALPKHAGAPCPRACRPSTTAVPLCCRHPPPPPDYNFIRLGKDGLRREFDNLYRIYDHLKARLEAMGEGGMSRAMQGWARAAHSISLLLGLCRTAGHGCEARQRSRFE